ncbi:hypothetical protein FOXB_06297 [Fusarium oxysporum f. sp. conglutinans Fo5176]|uniref:Uncharacterized protein n=1 Tax=Fusarium oxysporum (strain Fo5176) TaxID=660025 RepID=F9FIR8_FUSOF|nr:hypothetical protein FOXB_06297 [Fusarium oxysporum f. sp. conglutinans Fo5176]
MQPSSFISAEKQYATHIEGEAVVDEYLPLFPFLVNKSLEERQKIETKLKRKLDWVFLPVVTLMLLMGYLDRINVANARLAGMQDDLHMSDTMWSAGISLFYVGYIITQLPDTVYLAKGLPRWQMPAYVTAWLYIESSLYRWATSLPQELQVAPSSQPTHSYLANRHNLPARQLYLPYLTSLRVLSRMQPAHSGGSVTATLAVSFVARIFEDFLARDEIKVLAPISTRYCLISSMALVSVMPNKRLWDAVQPDLEILQLALTELSRRWRSAIGASKVLQNAINKRRQRNSSSTAVLRMDDKSSLEYFKMIDLGYCRIWSTLSQQMSSSPLATQEQIPEPIQPRQRRVSDRSVHGSRGGAGYGDISIRTCGELDSQRWLFIRTVDYITRHLHWTPVTGSQLMFLLSIPQFLELLLWNSLDVSLESSKHFINILSVQFPS